ncbi:glycoside hydrolase family 43 protein [Salisediminibacterium selenitireducens]|uniref:Xylan 1,4-beta-xylosidase n=1 Tax=Bacillus selenitireducens (strain ATCC 700615 / DSM 15326 / MLS10) TaxID=439292 RepID=D6XZ41_BACIE|nr:glycoside hydrolase family 43 protein [Salisediminibacterium selenitireducens]ADI00326.1 Xylan 1,4-beta-xylosidase [[Bacillus] selenitireducens MLS10]
MTMITNPILPGFHADPSICRVGDDFYIATSTFDWFPGVRIHHSRDLKHWRHIASPLDRVSLLDLKGNMNSGGVWAPCLSYSDGLFYLIYTDVKQWHGAFKDTHNYLVTAPSIEGPWSEPIYLNSNGFDPSLFHDDDGRKWLVNMLWDFRKDRHPFAGIVLQEYSPLEQKLTGPVKMIYEGTEIKLTEGPHLYKRNGYYYLFVAEGGTQYEHAETVARSKAIDGPYETDPHYPFITAWKKPHLPIQKSGHGSLVDTPEGEWYFVHLGGRPVNGKYCTLGRETFIQKAVWTDDDWIRLADGSQSPSLEVEGPTLPDHPFEAEPVIDDFDDDSLFPGWWNSLRIPMTPDWVSLTERPGHLRLKGMESMTSLHSQALIARRQTDFQCTIETALDYQPEHFQHMGGMTVFYDTTDFLYLHITAHPVKGRVLQIMQMTDGEYDEVLLSPQTITPSGTVKLKGIIDIDHVQFYYMDQDTPDWVAIGPALDVTHMSDDSAPDVRFTGTFVGMATQDLSGTRKPCDFDYFKYEKK